MKINRIGSIPASLNVECLKRENYEEDTTETAQIRMIKSEEEPSVTCNHHRKMVFCKDLIIVSGHKPPFTSCTQYSLCESVRHNDQCSDPRSSHYVDLMRQVDCCSAHHSRLVDSNSDTPSTFQPNYSQLLSSSRIYKGKLKTPPLPFVFINTLFLGFLTLTLNISKRSHLQINRVRYCATVASSFITFRAYNSAIKTASLNLWNKSLSMILLVLLILPSVQGNASPRFIVETSSEIVVNVKEGPDTPIGTVIATVKGEDADGDDLTFGIQGAEGRDLLEVRTSNADPNQAQLVLRKLLDRELREEYRIILSLSDGKLGNDKFITQSLLLLVEDVNDNEPIFAPFESTIVIEENSRPRVLATLTATDKDEGPYGQVVYSLSGAEESDADVFSVRTVNDAAELKLVGSLDYERKSLFQLKILAMDRSPGGRINTGTAAVIIEVKDVEDMNPTFIKVPPVTRVPEDIPVNSYVLQVNAIDGDRGVNNQIQYRILDGDHGFFELEASTGFLYVKQPLDREHQATGEAFFIKILAEEMTTAIFPAPSAETEVTVVLEDVNDQTPTFRASHYVAGVAEGAQLNMPVSLIGDAIPEVYDDDQVRTRDEREIHRVL